MYFVTSIKSLNQLSLTIANETERYEAVMRLWKQLVCNNEEERGVNMH
jgi:hypothetical protein